MITKEKYMECLVKDCTNEGKIARGYCMSHYKVWWKIFKARRTSKNSRRRFYRSDPFQIL